MQLGRVRGLQRTFSIEVYQGKGNPHQHDGFITVIPDNEKQAWVCRKIHLNLQENFGIHFCPYLQTFPCRGALKRARYRYVKKKLNDKLGASCRSFVSQIINRSACHLKRKVTQHSETTWNCSQKATFGSSGNKTTDRRVVYPKILEL